MYVDLISPVNQTGGEIKGVELAFQHTMTWLPGPFDGFGILANFTHQEGSRDATFKLPGFLNDTGDVVELPLNFRGLSENAYNFTTFYEKALSVHVSVTLIVMGSCARRQLIYQTVTRSTMMIVAS